MYNPEVLKHCTMQASWSERATGRHHCQSARSIRHSGADCRRSSVVCLGLLGIINGQPDMVVVGQAKIGNTAVTFALKHLPTYPDGFAHARNERRRATEIIRAERPDSAVSSSRPTRATRTSARPSRRGRKPIW